MFRQDTPEYYHQTVRGNERHSEQTYIGQRPHYNRWNPNTTPPEYTTQWDWFSLLGFVFPLVVLMIPAGIASIAYVTAFILSGSDNIYVNLFLLYSLFILLYVQSLYLLLGERIRVLYNIKRYAIISWIYPFLIAEGIWLLFFFIIRLHVELNRSFYHSLNVFMGLFLFIAIVFIIPVILGLLIVYIQYKYDDTLFVRLYFNFFAKYARRIGFLEMNPYSFNWKLR